MRLGVCSSDFAPASPEALFAKMEGYGFGLAQFSFSSIGMEEIPARVDKETLQRVQQAAAQHHIEIVALNGTFNLVDPQEERKEECFRRLPGLCAACAELGAEVLTLCTGTYDAEDMWRYHPRNTQAGAWEEMLAGVKRTLDIARPYGLTLGIETEASNIVRTPALARRLLDALPNEKLGILFDAANLFLPGSAWPERVRPVLDEAFAAFGDRVLMAHGKDIRAGEGIDFTATGHGIVDWPYFLQGLRQQGFTGPMLLHGIYDESLMPGCVAFMRRIMEECGLAES